MDKDVIIRVMPCDVTRANWIRSYAGNHLHFGPLAHAASRVPDVAYRLGYVEAVVIETNREGFLGIWDWRLKGINKYYKLPLPDWLIKDLLILRERQVQEDEDRVFPMVSFTIKLPYCNDAHLHKSPLEIIERS